MDLYYRQHLLMRLALSAKPRGQDRICHLDFPSTFTGSLMFITPMNNLELGRLQETLQLLCPSPEPGLVQGSVLPQTATPLLPREQSTCLNLSQPESYSHLVTAIH